MLYSTDDIINSLNEIFQKAATVGTDITIADPSSNSGVYSIVTGIMDNAVMPVAYVVLSLLFLLEIYNITIRMDGISGTMGVELPFRAMIKIAICKIAVDNTATVLELIYSLTSQMMTNITPNVGAVAFDAEIYRSAIDDLGMWGRIPVGLEVTLISFVFGFAVMAAQIIIMGRLIEIYLLTAIAPVPMATLANQDMSSVGKNFLKSFVAVCIQGVFIALVLALYGGLTAGIMDGTPASFKDAMFSCLQYSVILVVALFSCGKWAKSVCNAM